MYIQTTSFAFLVVQHLDRAALYIHNDSCPGQNIFFRDIGFFPEPAIKRIVPVITHAEILAFGDFVRTIVLIIGGFCKPRFIILLPIDISNAMLDFYGIPGFAYETLSEDGIVSVITAEHDHIPTLRRIRPVIGTQTQHISAYGKSRDH